MFAFPYAGLCRINVTEGLQGLLFLFLNLCRPSFCGGAITSARKVVGYLVKISVFNFRPFEGSRRDMLIICSLRF